MTAVIKSIFGKTFEFRFSADDASIVIGSICRYPDGVAPADVVVLMNQRERVLGKTVAQNPASLSRTEGALVMEFPSCTIGWCVGTPGQPLHISLSMKQRRFWRRHLSRWRSMEFPTQLETFEQLLHELVLIPSMYFFEDRSLVHAASIAVDGKGVLLAGTGGTGKTSAMLAMRNEERVSFVSDDIAVVSPDGHVYPNLAWPKIYGYNLSIHISREEILAGRGVFDRAHFVVRNRRNPSTVRRKIEPAHLYRHVQITSAPIEGVYYLFRQNVKELFIEDLPPETAVDMGLLVMSTEYAIFHKFLDWGCYNALGLGEAPVATVADVMNVWRRTLLRAFKKKNVKIVRIPIDLPHEAYLSRIRNIVLLGL